MGESLILFFGYESNALARLVTWAYRVRILAGDDDEGTPGPPAKSHRVGGFIEQVQDPRFS